ncbi:aldehyde dehydrogenase [Halobacteriales archaeon QS_1_68_20]|nr:MAG: aldehyde dehydrogenase [Halobacteriales archaeon QS_1_68_20]
MTASVVQRKERLYVGGEWIDADDEIAVHDLAEGGTFARVAAADAEQADAALAAAHEAKGPMFETTPVERAAWLEEIAEGLEAREEPLAGVIVREAGKPIGSARGEVASAAERFRRAADEARTLARDHGEYREGSTASHEGWRAIVKPEPIGTVLCIAPYNYPLSTTALQVAPALAAGNSVVLKPASATPISAAIMAEVIEAGAGKHVARQSGMVNLHMELGGNAPAIVFPDADLSAVAGACTKGSIKYAGQRCSAVSRILAHESVHDEVVERMDAEMEGWGAGDLFEEETAFGPLISVDQAQWVQELVDDAVERGADLVRGGSRRAPEGVPDELADQFFEPTLLANVSHDARIVHEEQFGPVAVVTTFEDEEGALSVANDTDLALDASVFTSDYDRALRVAERVDAGAVRINGAPSHGIGDVPFGGNKDSGIGREGIGASIEAMLRTKSIVL